MDIGAILDFCIEYNEIHNKEYGSESENITHTGPRVRKATQADWDAFAG